MKSRIVGVFLGILLVAGMSACSSQKPLYSWNNYNKELLSYYKNPGELNKFAEKLFEDIEKAEIDGKVPPGLYAEYGYAMLELGDSGVAIIYFEKERDMWPEAVFLMEAVISRLGPIQDSESLEDG